MLVQDNKTTNEATQLGELERGVEYVGRRGWDGGVGISGVRGHMGVGNGHLGVWAMSIWGCVGIWVGGMGVWA